MQIMCRSCNFTFIQLVTKTTRHSSMPHVKNSDANHKPERSRDGDSPTSFLVAGRTRGASRWKYAQFGDQCGTPPLGYSPFVFFASVARNEDVAQGSWSLPKRARSAVFAGPTATSLSSSPGRSSSDTRSPVPCRRPASWGPCRQVAPRLRSSDPPPRTSADPRALLAAHDWR